MAELVAAHDWAATALGPLDDWPRELRMILDLVLASRFPMVFWWGPNLIQFYNDAYLPIMGDKHPVALGQTAHACWSEIWSTIGPQITSIYRGAPATWNEDVLLDIERHGFIGESYFTWSYSPLPDPSAASGIGGVLCTVQETTDKVIGERRILLLRDLATNGHEPRSAQDECKVAAATLARYERSVPFSLIYLVDPTGTTAELAALGGTVAAQTPLCPPAVDLRDPDDEVWPLARACRTESLVYVESLDALPAPVPPGPWPEPARAAVVVPIPSGIAHEPAGVLVAGVNPRERFDERYRSFYELIAGQIAAAISNARAYENERKRAEALAELDRAKIEFFSNVSHEFRTPLTLMLGPIAKLLRDADPADAPLLETAHRNALRLLKLVNMLLEFSRLEAGRNDATFVETDLAALTHDLCGLFRSAVESAGLVFAVDIDLGQRAFVDRSMWEMIVLNLLSNALKFTHRGAIRLTLTEVAGTVELAVRDSGIGISAADLPHVLERFRRVRGAKSRSHEGSGIGLALVDELVRLHGGTIDVESTLDVGSCFRIRIPLGRDHLDPARLASTMTAQPSSVVEQYLADVDSTIVRADVDVTTVERRANVARILLADDNGDLRSYVARILAPYHDVIAVRTGVEALAVLRAERIDLVVSDVMMPDMDGFELIRALRADPAFESIPFIMLSARAGEEAAIEGLTRGADDYLVKPFSAEELVARVFAQLNAAAIRERALRDLRANEERFRTLAASMPHIVLEGNPEHGVTFLSEAFTAYTGLPAKRGLGSGWLTVVHPDDLAETERGWERAARAGEGFSREFRLRRADGVYRWHVGRALVQRDAGDGVVRLTGTITDIHEMRRSAQERAFLSDASRILAQSLDLETTLLGLAKVTVPLFADWCQIDLATREGGVRTMALYHRDPELNERAQHVVGRIHLNAGAERGSPYSIRTGRSHLIDDVRGAALDVVADRRELELYTRLGLRSCVCVPLVAEGRTLGAISVVYGSSERRFSADDVPVLEELGRRAGVAVQRASEFEREHRVAQSFQSASLPIELPSLPSASFDAVYVPANDEAQVGGDWYDALRLADGRVVVSIGDVAGNGLRAAVTMGNMRQIIRGIAQVHADPALMLDAADRALRLEHPDRFVTAFVGVFDPVTGIFAYASAGHPPPVLRQPSGAIDLLSDGGLPLGLRNAAKGHGRTIRLEPGASILFYTDGLTEAARRPADGEQRLRDLIGEPAIFAARHPAQALMNAIFADRLPSDDVAILVMRVTDERTDSSAPIQRWFFDTRDGQAAQAARRAFRDGLGARFANAECIADAELVFGELVGNAARYAPGPLEVCVDWSSAMPVLHVLDEGRGFAHVPSLPRDVYSESGRGLFIISLYSEEFSVSKRPDRGSHARAVLALNRQPFSKRAELVVPEDIDPWALVSSG